MRDHDIDNDITTSTQPPQLDCSTNPSALSSAHDTPTTSTSKNLEKTSGQWTETEINLLLDFVEGNCILTTARGLNLKKSEFNKAHTIVKSKDVNQCHYKWGHVHILLSMLIFITYLLLRLQNIFSYKPVLAFGTEQMAIFNSRESKF